MASLALLDGRSLDVRVSGPSDGLPLLFHHGVPGTLPTRGFERAAHARGLRLVSFSRPGFGGSTRRAGRAVVDVVADAAAVLQSVGADRYLLAGWSGGGPHALACAARLPGAIGALIVSGLAPPYGDGLDFMAGMDQDNRDEWAAAQSGEVPLRAYVEPIAPTLTAAPPRGGVPDWEALLPAADANVMAGDFGQDLLEANRDGMRLGIDGWVDDELAFARPWGFDFAEVSIPVTIWHGRDDVNVPLAHGVWVSSQIPHGVLHREAGDGHFSIMVGPVDRMLAELTGSE